jgi:hypothetical protein
MRANVDIGIRTRWEVDRPHVIEEDERADHAPSGNGQYAAYFQTAAKLAAALFDDGFYHACLLRRSGL